MKYSEAIKIMPSNKRFGLSFSLIFIIIFLYCFFYDLLDGVKYSFIFLSFVLFTLSIIKDRLLFPLNIGWLYVGIFLGKIFSPIILGIIYFCVFTPISIFFKLIKRDVLNLNKIANRTMWKTINKKKVDMIYFRNQY